jgi:cyclopropane-fatty-acyl-phospholipid synthase
MTSTSFVSHPHKSDAAAPARTASAPSQSARLVLSLLQRITVGSLTVHDPQGVISQFGKEMTEPAVVVRLHNWNMLEAALKNGDIGFAETYMDGDWTCDNLSGLIELMCLNRAAMESAIYGSWWGRLAYRVKHFLNRNTRAQAQKNIQAHYDLGNDFYKLWLDRSMTYSSALFSAPTQSLYDAQLAKYQRIIDTLQLRANDKVLEIGCGWGGFAEQATETGAHVTGLTLSPEQRDYATARLQYGLQAAAPRGTAHFLLQDYRDTIGQYDHIVSIEMFEAVGEAFWGDYFKALKRNLKPGGRAMVQSIVIDDALFERYRVGTDFIQQYVFPGGMLPSPSVFRSEAAKAGLQVVGAHAFGRDYARTLREWRGLFMSKLTQVQALQPQNGLQAFDTRFIHLWEFYLAYCEGAFDAGNTDVMQFELAHA